MRIARFKATRFRIPFRNPPIIAGVRLAERRGLLLELFDGDERAGIGEASCLPAMDGDVSLETERAVLLGAEALLGIDPRDLETAANRLQDIAPSPARAGLEMALYDLAGKALGVKAANLLGGARRHAVAANALITAGRPESAAAEARRAKDAGFCCLKLKLSADVDDGVSRVAAVRESVGNEVALRLDPNAMWCTEAAIGALQRLRPFRIEYVEQPVATLSEMAMVRRAVEIPIAADESVTGTAAVDAIAASGAADLLIVKPSRLGLTEACRVIDAARDHDLEVVVTSGLDTSVGIAAALHVASSVSRLPYACGLATVDLLDRDLVRASLRPSNGLLALPAAPGLGIELDCGALARCRERDVRDVR